MSVLDTQTTLAGRELVGTTRVSDPAFRPVTCEEN